MGYTLYLTFRDLLGIKCSYRCRSKEGWWRRILRWVSIVLPDNFPRKSHYSFLRQGRINPLRWGAEVDITENGEVSSTGRKYLLESMSSISSALSGSSHISPSQLRGSHYFAINAFTSSVRLGVQLCCYSDSHIMRFCIWFSTIPVLWLQEMRISFQAHIEDFSSFLCHLS